MFDLGPAAREMTRLVQGVGDDQLAAPTPCPAYALGDLLEHVHGLALAFRMAADKQIPEGGGSNPPGDARRLPEDWRGATAERLTALVAAWTKEDAWQGTTHIAGFDAPADNVAVTALNELVVHGWDVAVASGQTLELDDVTVQACLGFAEILSGPGGDAVRGTAFGPEVAVPPDAAPLDRILGANGRDPRWGPGRATR
jgi:uncharacterized protein (TIGR03086 family)